MHDFDRWSPKKLAIFWGIILGIPLILVAVSYFVPKHSTVAASTAADSTSVAFTVVLVIVGIVVIGAIILLIYGVGTAIIGFIVAIIADIGKFKKKRRAKSDAYYIIKTQRIYNNEAFEEMCEILKDYAERIPSDSEAELLLQELGKLEKKLKRKAVSREH